MMPRLALLFLLVLAVAGCKEEAASVKPAPVQLTLEAAGHYCQMTVLEHDGPKAQIHLAGNSHPFWFTQVRDAVAFTRLPEEPKEYVAIYVNDMAKAESWAQPGTANWIDADAAWFVISSRQLGGMGAPEAIPFGTHAAADAFVSENGGAVVRFGEIPSEYVLAPVVSGNPGVPMSRSEPAGGGHATGMHHAANAGEVKP